MIRIMNRKIIAFILVTAVVAAGIVLILVRNKDAFLPGETSAAPSIVTAVTSVSETDETVPEDPLAAYRAMSLNSETDARAVIEAFAADNGLSVTDYPDDIIGLLGRNPDALEYVLNFPLHEAEEEPDIDLSGEVNRFEVPRLYQWDARWGYKIYGSGPMGLTGCGPTCLSMVAIHLLGNTDMNPAWMAEYAMNNGYYDYDGNSGTYWTLMTDGAFGLGIDVTEIPTDEDRMIRNLEVGNPIIAIVGEGEFTDNGHFIVITGYEDGYFTVNDPNSYTRSDRLWTFDELEEEIITCWVYRIL